VTAEPSETQRAPADLIERLLMCSLWASTFAGLAAALLVVAGAKNAP